MESIGRSNPCVGVECSALGASAVTSSPPYPIWDQVVSVCPAPGFAVSDRRDSQLSRSLTQTSRPEPVSAGFGYHTVPGGISVSRHPESSTSGTARYPRAHPGDTPGPDKSPLHVGAADDSGPGLSSNLAIARPADNSRTRGSVTQACWSAWLSGGWSRGGGTQEPVESRATAPVLHLDH